MEDLLRSYATRYCAVNVCIVLILLCRTVPTRAACPSQCRCLSQARVDCTSSNLWEFPADLPASSKVLSLSTNLIHVLNKDHFSDLTSLEELHVDRNALSVLNDNTFLLLSRLLILDLRYNRIKVLARGAFYGLSQLTHLQLEGNRITTVDQLTFVSLTALVQLDLYDNQLRNLPPAVFHNNRKLNVLNMGMCDLERIPRTLLKGLHRLSYLNMSENHHITNIAEGVFGDLTNLTKLTLDGCGLTSMHLNTFKGLTRLRQVYLDGNSFSDAMNWDVFAHMPPSVRYVSLTKNSMSALHELSLQHLSRIPKVNLSPNEWRCDCSLLNVRMAYMEERPAYIAESGVVCDSPEAIRGQELWSVPVKTIMENCVNALVSRVHKSTVDSGSEIQFDCPISRVNESQLAWYTPTPTYLSSTPDRSSEGAVTSDRRYTLLPNGTLFLSQVKQKDAGLYICSVRNIDGSSSWSVVQLNVDEELDHDHQGNASIYVAVVTTFAIILVCAAIAAVIYRLRRKKAQSAPLVNIRPKVGHGLLSLAARISRKSMPSDETYAYAYAEVPIANSKSITTNAYAIGALLKTRENGYPMNGGIGNNNINGGLTGTSAQRIVTRSCREKVEPKSPFIRTSRSIARCETYGYVSPNIQGCDKLEEKHKAHVQVNGSMNNGKAMFYDVTRPDSAGYLEIIG
ncbi:uncharacterized protein [Diadema setosum]|uniref:uncharacterized protein n=1 Tax=Diadema setosum TaxID=31175 RepID=UPI003B3B17B6